MPPERVERKLTAIVAADVAGYSRLMGADEESTLARLKMHRRELVDPKIAKHHGRIVKTTGDGMLVEFASVVDAMRCAVEVQQGMAERNTVETPKKRIEFRVGINLGDIIIDGDDIHGDGVNIAARLETLAEPGGICISRTVLDHIRGKIPLDVEDRGEQALKNIAVPVHVFRVLLDSPRGQSAAQTRAPPLALPDKPSIAVLPFQNMSGDVEQEYFSDGIVEEIITALSRMRRLFVIARNSSFAFKGRRVDLKEVGRELGVRYVLEGSVRKAANRLRITGQLIDAATGTHLWADRFDGGIDDVFELQDRVTSSVVGAIAPTLEQAEIERAKRKPTESLQAYDYYLRGMAAFYQRTSESNSAALQLFYRAIALDPEFAPAYGMAAFCFVLRKVNGWITDRAQEIAEATRLAQRALALGKNDTNALTRAGYAIGYVVGDLDSGVVFLDRALALEPNLATAWFLSGWLRAYCGELETAIDHHTTAIRLSPLDPSLHHMQNGIGFAHLLAGRYDEASSWSGKAYRSEPTYLSAAAVMAASHALAGRAEDAREAMERIIQIDRALRVSNLKDWFPIRRGEHLARYAEGLRKAGLPE